MLRCRHVWAQQTITLFHPRRHRDFVQAAGEIIELIPIVEIGHSHQIGRLPQDKCQGSIVDG